MDHVGVGGRPRSVRVAAILLAVAGVAYLADAAVVIAGAAAYPDRVRKALLASDVDPNVYDSFKPVAGVLPYVAAVVTVVAALVLVCLAVTVRSGRNAGRIVAWVAIGLSLSCSFCGLGQAGTPTFSGIAYVRASSNDAAGTHTFEQRLPVTYPPAYRILSGGFALVAMIALIVACVQLMRQSAHTFYRPQPPISYFPGYPNYPGQFAPAPAAERDARLATLARQHQRGELTDEQFAAARQQILGNP
jgi:TRAP-type C4-dicarboxylate transport system permease small subunit